MKPIEIVYGYSREHRPDLKKFIMQKRNVGSKFIPKPAPTNLRLGLFADAKTAENSV